MPDADDLLFLVSRELDGDDLTTAEREVLARALEESGDLRLAAEQFRRVDRLVQRWAQSQPDVNADTVLAHSVGSVLPDAPQSDEDEIDHLIGRWASTRIRTDESRYTAEVMRRVRAAAPQRSIRPRLFRLGVPLAAAAAVGFAVIGQFWPTSTPAPRSTVLIARQVQSVDTEPMQEQVALVSFARQSVNAGNGGAPAAVGMLSMGVYTDQTRGGDSAPL